MNAGGMSRLVQPQECIITTKILLTIQHTVVKRHTLDTLPPSPPNVIMTLIFPQGL